MSTNLPAAIEHLTRGLAATHARTAAVASGGGEQFLKLQKSGTWAFGADGVEVENGSLWAVDPKSFRSGFIAWDPDDSKAATKLGEEMRLATDPPIIRESLPDVGGPWQEQMGIDLMCLTGEDSGTECIYSTTSRGGLRALHGLLGEVVAVLNRGETDAIIPVIELLTDSYQHKRYGKIFNPVLEVRRWGSITATAREIAENAESDAQLNADAKVDGVPEAAPSPAPVAPAPVPAPEPAQAAPAPARRRRRRVA